MRKITAILLMCTIFIILIMTGATMRIDWLVKAAFGFVLITSVFISYYFDDAGQSSVWTQDLINEVHVMD